MENNAAEYIIGGAGSPVLIRETADGLSGEALCCDTLCRVRVCGGFGKELVAELFALCFRLEAKLSMFIRDSDISRINRSKGEKIRVSPETAELLRLALRCSDLTGGLFDVTAREGFISSRGGLELSGESVTLRAGSRVDLGGIAKGHICDAAARLLRERGVKSALLDFGGNILALGPSPLGRPWRVGLRDPKGAADSFFAVVEARDTAVVTSALYERGEHIFDPRTGKSARGTVLSATAIAGSAAVADALSTALFVGGTRFARDLYKTPGLNAELVTAEENGRIFHTPGLDGKIQYNAGTVSPGKRNRNEVL